MPKSKISKLRSAKAKKHVAKKPAAKKRAAAPSSGPTQDKSLREHLLALLRSSNAHIDFEKTFADFPPDSQGKKAGGLPHSPWQLLEHLRIAQWDIVEFSHDAKHVSPEFPSGYWPKTDEPPDPAAWDKSVASFRRDLKKMETLIADPKVDLHAQIPGGHGHTILREALLLADHNAYHLGQLLILRRLLGVWNG